jgi:hypothetical protein
VNHCRSEREKPGKLTQEQRRRLCEFLVASHKIVPRLVPNEDDQPSTRGSELSTASGALWAPSTRGSEQG